MDKFLLRQILPSLQPASLLTPLTLTLATSDNGGRDPELGHMGFYSAFHGYSGIFKTHFKIQPVQEATAPGVLFTPYFRAEKLYLRL